MTEIYFVDGASKGNSQDGIMYAAFYHRDKLVMNYIGTGTNNTAEYHGLLMALHDALRKGYKDLIIKCDSQVVIGQVSKGWNINYPHLEKLCAKAKELIKKFNSVKFVKIRSHENKADLKWMKHF